MNGRRKAKEIREEKIGNQNKRALIVEGKDDEIALTILLQHHHSNWEQRWVIARLVTNGRCKKSWQQNPAGLG